MTSEPQTESGRALLRDLAWTEDVLRTEDAYLPAILAIEQEAASAAVAEVLDRLENLPRWGTVPTLNGPTVMQTDDGPFISRDAALIASERER